MDFAINEEHLLLRASLQQFLQQRYSFAQRKAASRDKPGYRTEIWRALGEELGVLGMTIAEANGGLGADVTAQMVLMEQVGAALMLEPVAETAFQAGYLLERAGGPQCRALLNRIATGNAVLAVALGEPGMRHDLPDIAMKAVPDSAGWRINGRKSVVMAAPWADQVIVAARTDGEPGAPGGLSLFVIDPAVSGLAIHAYPTLDGRQAADLVFADVYVPAEALIGPEGNALPLIEAMRDRAIAAQAAEAAGLLDRMVSDTVEYCKNRSQFGQPLSRFQVLQHRMVDMWMQVELVRSAVVLACGALDGEADARALAASAAKVTVANACRFVGQNAVQLHGGMGMTDELAIGHYFKRATMIESEHGSADWHLARYARLQSTKQLTASAGHA